MRKRKPASAKRKCVIPAQFDRPAPQAFHFDTLLDFVGPPTVCLPPSVTPCCHAKGRGKSRIELDCPVELSQRDANGLACPLVKARHAAQIVIVSVQVLSR